MWAVANRRDEVARVLIESGADVHARSSVVPRAYQTGSRYVAYDDVRFVVKVEEGGFTPLLFAARSGDAASAGAAARGGRESGRRRRRRARRRSSSPRTAGTGPSPRCCSKEAPIRTRPARDIRRFTRRSCAATSALVKALLARGANADAALARGTPVRRYSQDFAFSADLIGATPFWLAARYGDVADHARAGRGAAPTRGSSCTTDPTRCIAAVAASSGFGSGDRRERYLTPVQIAERRSKPRTSASRSKPQRWRSRSARTSTM